SISVSLSVCYSSFVIDPAPTPTSTLSLHDALPISGGRARACAPPSRERPRRRRGARAPPRAGRAGWRQGWRGSPRAAGSTARPRSEEHTSELQSRENLVCRLLLEKKKAQDEYTKN